MGNALEWFDIIVYASFAVVISRLFFPAADGVTAAAERVKSPVLQTLSHHTGRVLSAAAAVGLASISVYLILYMPTFAVTNLGLPRYAGFLGGIISGLVSLIGVPLWASWLTGSARSRS